MKRAGRRRSSGPEPSHEHRRASLRGRVDPALVHQHPGVPHIVLQSFSVTPAELPDAFEEGIGFDGSSIEVYQRIQERDVVAIPIPETAQVLPFRAGFFCFQADTGPRLLDKAGYFDINPVGIGDDIREATVFAQGSMGIPVVYQHHQMAPPPPT